MDIRLLRTFVSVAANHSFSLAADGLFLTQPAVSQQVKALECELGVPLFVRGRLRTDLTLAGRELLPLAERMLELASQMTGHSVKQPVNGNLRLVTESGLASHFYAELISHFIFSKSNAVVDIVTGTGEAATSAVESGEADAAIVNLSSREAVLEKVELGESELVLVTAETCLAQFTADAQYLVWSGSRYLIRAFAERPELRAPLRSVDLELIIQALSSGFGYAFLPRWSVSAHLKSGKLREIAAPFPTIVERCGIVYSCGNISPALNAFIAAAHEYLDRSFSSASSIRAL